MAKRIAGDIGYCLGLGPKSAARAARRFPLILELLADGSITLTTVTLLASELTPENHRAVLPRARHKSKRDVLLLVAEVHPRPETGFLEFHLWAAQSSWRFSTVGAPPAA